jgi:hypothetical protein
MINCELPVVSHDDSLAGCQPIVLDNIGRPEQVERLIHLITRHAFSGTSSGHTGHRHHLLGESLAAFQLRGIRRWSEAGDTPLPYHIGHTRN